MHLPNQLLAMMRVGVLRGGLELESEKSIPPSEKLRVVSHEELASYYGPQNQADTSFESAPPDLASSSSSGDEEDEGPPTPETRMKRSEPAASKA